MYHEISREDVPAGSFRYGQFASEPGFAVRANCWAVCTDCSKARDETGRAGFDTVLVANFVFESEDNARYCAAKLAESEQVGRITLVRPYGV